MKISIYLIIGLLPIFLGSPVSAWEGYDYETGNYVEIEKGNLVRPGQDIEIYDYESGEYHDAEVQNIQGSGSGAEVEVYDSNTGEYRSFEME